MATQAHIPTIPAAQIPDAENRNEPCRADIALIGTSLRTAERDGVNAVIDFSVVHPAAHSYCSEDSIQNTKKYNGKQSNAKGGTV
jgi:hypothetical protein